MCVGGAVTLLGSCALCARACAGFPFVLPAKHVSPVQRHATKASQLPHVRTKRVLHRTRIVPVSYCRYDAITVEGRLAWQDGLTPRNAPFFDAADALFVNYK